MSNTPLEQSTFDLLFLNAHTHNSWQNKPVSEDLLHRLYEILRMAPTSMNSSPARIIFVSSQTEKEKLIPALMESNRAKTMLAPVTAIIGYDTHFYDQLPTLFPNNPKARDMFVNNVTLSELTAFRNGTLQGGYLILAARALGLDCGPMSGFDNTLVDQLFFSKTSVKSNFICNLGYGDPKSIYPRNPRLSFAEACSII